MSAEVDELPVSCSRCGKPLKKLGGLIFSPPMVCIHFGPQSSTVSKYHICVECWPDVISRFLKGT